jgi:hypothetical protein
MHLEICLSHMLLLCGTVQKISDGEPNRNCLSFSHRPQATQPNIAWKNDD